MEPTQPLASPTEDVRAALLDRRQRVESIARSRTTTAQARELLGEIDRAIERLGTGTYGICETCGDPIEPDRLVADPLLRFCIDHLSAKQARDLERDLDLAARVQRELLPATPLSLDGWSMAYRYQPLGPVSGDYLDVVRPTPERPEVAVFLGDIAGKGVAASMLMAHLHASVRTLVSLGLPVSQVVAQANRVFCESTMASHYATLVCARLSTGGDVEICNAGHCPPLLLHDGEVQEVLATGVPVGLFCVGDYGVQRLHLDPGDTLLLYTDGITEARNRADEEYGATRLTERLREHFALDASSLVDRCLEGFTTYRQGVPVADDVTVMAIRRQ